MGLGIHSPWLFATAVLVLNATPGVDMMLLLARTLQHGVRVGLAAALGVCTGAVLHALGAAFGLAALLAASAAAFTAVKWVGAAYLLYLAVGMLREAARKGEAPSAVEVAREREPMSLPLAFRQGLLTNALNPKVALFFLALLPQFIEAQSPHKTLAFLALGGWFVLQSLAFLIVFVLAVAPLARWRPGPSVRRSLHGAGGLLFAGLAARLALAER
jgi:threonine/homoserine/homoserine lactone efflux protein